MAQSTPNREATDRSVVSAEARSRRAAGASPCGSTVPAATEVGGSDGKRDRGLPQVRPAYRTRARARRDLDAGGQRRRGLWLPARGGAATTTCRRAAP